MDLKEQIKEALGLSKSVKLEWQSKMEDGTILVSTADTLESGVDISVLVEDGTTILLPAGTYKTQDGVSFRVEEEGIVAEVMETETEEVVEEEEMSEAKEDKKEDEEEKEDYESEAEETDWAKTYEELKDKVENLEDAIADIKAQLGDGDAEEMSEEVSEEVSEPSVNPKTIKTTEVKEFSMEELKAENERLKKELSKVPGDKPLVAEKFSSENKTKKLSKAEYSKLNASERFLFDLNN